MGIGCWVLGGWSIAFCLQTIVHPSLARDQSSIVHRQSSIVGCYFHRRHVAAEQKMVGQQNDPDRDGRVRHVEYGPEVPAVAVLKVEKVDDEAESHPIDQVADRAAER